MSRVPELWWVFRLLFVAWIVLTVSAWTGIAVFRHRRKRADERRENSLKEMGFR